MLDRAQGSCSVVRPPHDAAGFAGNRSILLSPGVLGAAAFRPSSVWFSFRLCPLALLTANVAAWRYSGRASARVSFSLLHQGVAPASARAARPRACGRTGTVHTPAAAAPARTVYAGRAPFRPSSAAPPAAAFGRCPPNLNRLPAPTRDSAAARARCCPFCMPMARGPGAACSRSACAAPQSRVGLRGAVALRLPPPPWPPPRAFSCTLGSAHSDALPSSHGQVALGGASRHSASP
jgi:hypothetical protein